MLTIKPVSGWELCSSPLKKTMLPMQSKRTSNPTHSSPAFPNIIPKEKCFLSTLQFQYCFDCLTERASKQNKRLFCLSYPPSPAQGDNLIQPHSQLSSKKIFALFCHVNQITGVWYICNQFAEKVHLSLCLQSQSYFNICICNCQQQKPKRRHSIIVKEQTIAT